MPELPEVEVVRRGLSDHLPGRTVAAVEVRHPRAVRRHAAGASDLVDRLVGTRLGEVNRRGKYLWVPAVPDRDPRPDARPAVPPSGERIVAHLGMSGQLLLREPDAPAETHLRVRIELAGEPALSLRFVDQRTFGGIFLASPVDASGSLAPVDALPAEIAHIAPDPLGGGLDAEQLWRRLRARRTGIKRALLDQTVLSGVGNIYADEALWSARLHPERPTATLTRAQVAALFTGLREVMTAALAVGGTSFDRLYVNVNGSSGRFDRSLHAYGRTGLPCERCGTPIVREPFANRSSHRCPHCQPVPRRRAATVPRVGANRR